MVPILFGSLSGIASPLRSRAVANRGAIMKCPAWLYDKTSLTIKKFQQPILFFRGNELQMLLLLKYEHPECAGSSKICQTN